MSRDDHKKWLFFCALAACGEPPDERDDPFGPTAPSPPATVPLPDENLSSSSEDLPAAVCGDGVQDPDEDCDDGPDNGAYGRCDETCGGPGLRCGDGRVDGPEACDDGNLDDADSRRPGLDARAHT